jgi:hypothetical protein
MQSHLERALDGAPQYLQWTWTSTQNPSPLAESQSAVAAAPFNSPFNHTGAVRANLHVSRIWAKSAMFERSVIAQTESHPSSEYNAETWETRIRIGEELLAFIESADTPSFEVNAPSIVSSQPSSRRILPRGPRNNTVMLTAIFLLGKQTSKIRRIAASLLLSDATIEIPADLGRRVRNILHRILIFLADLNRFSLQDTQFSEGMEKLARRP